MACSLLLAGAPTGGVAAAITEWPAMVSALVPVMVADDANDVVPEEDSAESDPNRESAASEHTEFSVAQPTGFRFFSRIGACHARSVEEQKENLGPFVS